MTSSGSTGERTWIAPDRGPLPGDFVSTVTAHRALLDQSARLCARLAVTRELRVRALSACTRQLRVRTQLLAELARAINAAKLT